MTIVELLIPTIPGVLLLLGLCVRTWARVRIAQATKKDPGPIYDGPERRKRPRS